METGRFKTMREAKSYLQSRRPPVIGDRNVIYIGDDITITISHVDIVGTKSLQAMLIKAGRGQSLKSSIVVRYTGGTAEVSGVDKAWDALKKKILNHMWIR